MNYVSLGSSCSIAYQLQILKLKKESLPFDWIRSNSVSYVLSLIQNNFDGFFDDLEHVKDDERFPFIEDNEEGLNHNFDAIPDKKTKIYKTKYLGFFHDFKDGVSLDEIKEKYDRRIKRFYNVIKNKCIFIRDDVKFKESDIGTYNLLNAELKKHNPESILVLIANTKLSSINGLDENIRVFIENEKVTEWQHHSIVPMIKSLVL